MAKFRHIIVLLMVASVLAACGGAPAANTQSTAAPEDQAITTAPAAAEATSTAGPATEPRPTAEATTESAAQGAGEAPLPPEGTATTAAAPADGDIKAALQKTVDVWSQAYNEADPELLGKAIDPNARALGRTQRDLVKYYSESQGLARDWKGTVAEVEQLEQGYVLAYVDIGSARYPMTFKQVDGQWLLSEPRRAELGKKKEIETEHFTFEYYPWDEAIGPEIAQMMEEAHKSIVEKMGRAPDKKSRVRLNPTTELALTSGGVLAFYRSCSGAQQGTKEMVINSPRSFAAGGFNAEAGWQADLLVTLAHEYA
ncbi:MAG: hypothetical protein M3380_09420, partial [Chloroflexota bacterium]|nr:hypothetical protein [Chloroflexota bacterium]